MRWHVSRETLNSEGSEMAVDRTQSSMSPLVPPPPAASTVFGDDLPAAVAYAEMLATSGVERGLLGPREVGRLWDRHLLNSAVIGDWVPRDARVVDLGSGAGLPGIPLALARRDCAVTLLESMARRVAWLEEVVATLDVPVTVVRGRAEEPAIRHQLGGADVVIARAVAPLARLCGWSLPLLRPGGVLLALKGVSAADEVMRDRRAVLRVGGGEPRVGRCGAGLVDVPATVVMIERVKLEPDDGRARRTRKDR
jgi:16S rRNA (guanine527-N7)-methyltransferase